MVVVEWLRCCDGCVHGYGVSNWFFPLWYHKPATSHSTSTCVGGVMVMMIAVFLEMVMIVVANFLSVVLLWWWGWWWSLCL